MDTNTDRDNMDIDRNRDRNGYRDRNRDRERDYDRDGDMDQLLSVDTGREHFSQSGPSKIECNSWRSLAAI
jgi:hypothetical protein